MTAVVTRIPARSGNRDHDYFQPKCAACSWDGVLYSNRTIEGRSLAERDTAEHNRAHPVPELTR